MGGGWGEGQEGIGCHVACEVLRGWIWDVACGGCGLARSEFGVYGVRIQGVWCGE